MAGGPGEDSASAAAMQLPHGLDSLRIQNTTSTDGMRKRFRPSSSLLSLITKNTAHALDQDHLDRVAAAVYPGCMGLPQELIERITDTLQDDMTTLKACSLTCKSMYASARHLIHETLYLTARSIRRVRMAKPIPFPRRWDEGPESPPANFWDLLTRTGFLKYTRHVYINITNTIALSPYFERLSTFDRVHTLTVHSTDIHPLTLLPLPPLSPLYTNLSTLSIHFPRNPHICLPAFIAQFPNLENLTLELAPRGGGFCDHHHYPTRSPPLRGHLRCSGISQHDYIFTRALACDLPDGINFRSAEFKEVHRKRCHQLLGACKDTLEEFIVTICGNGMQISTLQVGLYSSLVSIGHPGIMESGGLTLKQNLALRRFVVRVAFTDLTRISLPVLQRVLKTIRSPIFSDFVLELGTPKAKLTSDIRPQICGRWTAIDRRLARCGSVRLVIRTAGAHEDEAFRERTKEVFPLMAESGLILFETSPSVNEYWG